MSDCREWRVLTGEQILALEVAIGHASIGAVERHWFRLRETGAHIEVAVAGRGMPSRSLAVVVTRDGRVVSVHHGRD